MPPVTQTPWRWRSAGGKADPMGKVLEQLDDNLTAWVQRQHVFFVATAPLGAEGRVNVSPKGYDSFRILSPTRVAYLDLTGSGAETIAHLRENGRITVMFVAFEGPPNIVRLHGKGQVHTVGDPAFDALLPAFSEYPGARSIIEIDVERVSTSCGYSIPFMDYAGERDTLVEWAERRGDDGVHTYHGEKNRHSIDGLPALEGTPAIEGG